MRPSTNSWKFPCDPRHWYLWGISIILIFCWIRNTATHAQSRRFLQCVEDYFLTQVVEELMRRGVLLVLVLTKRERLVRYVKAGGSLG